MEVDFEHVRASNKAADEELKVLLFELAGNTGRSGPSRDRE
jgi:hypothetical protein